jgi:hypothetical protein
LAEHIKLVDFLGLPIKLGDVIAPKPLARELLEKSIRIWFGRDAGDGNNAIRFKETAYMDENP